MRNASISRRTAETDVSVSLDLDGTGKAAIATGVGFLDHMLELFARHALFDAEIKVTGDLHVDQHHTTEDAASPWGRPSPRRSATSAASRATPTFTCRWTRP